MEDVMRYAMKLVTCTHPELEESPALTKKYIRFGASPRAGQALITAGKVRAMMAGRYNVSYEDINTLAYPVLRHRIKLSFQAVTDKMTPDTLIRQLVEEVSGKKAAEPKTVAESGQKKSKLSFRKS